MSSEQYYFTGVMQPRPVDNMTESVQTPIREHYMVSIQLDAVQQRRLNELAKSQGENGEAFAHRILVDYLDFHGLPSDSEDDWARVSVALTPEIMQQETWDEFGQGSH